MCTLCVTKELFYERDDHFLALIINWKKNNDHIVALIICMFTNSVLQKYSEQKVALNRCTFYTLIKIFEFYQ